jgi:CBS domain-containing protein/gamma-glutamylcysteine synthetase
MSSPDAERESEELRRFTQHLLRDVQALEEVLHSDLMETGRRHIGAEQEFFLVDRNWRPAPVNTEILDRIDDPRVVPELGRFNLELNAEPVPYGGDCLSRLHEQIEDLLELVHRTARELDAEILLTGILPTLRKSDLSSENMTPKERYRRLEETLLRMRGGKFDFYLRGTDEMHLETDSILVEAANTSFQIHFQVDPDEFARLYNVAQAVTAPVLAVGVNSPVLFGKRLWHETRIALFQQSVDTRAKAPDVRDIPPRVTFGRQWVEESVLEIYQEDIARFRSIFYEEPEEDPFEAIEEGRAPQLAALQLHNGTVYRWNRPCYGLSSGGKAHLRIENRVLPSGPTVLDEMANAAFWFGLLNGVAGEHGDITEVMDFDDARGNFIAAARLGMGAQLTWTGGEAYGVQELVLERLLPLAREGLRDSGIDEDDVRRYLQVVEERVDSGQTGAVWMLRSLAEMKEEGTPEERLRAVTGATASRQRTGRPGHEWELASLAEGGGWRPSYLQLEGFMDTDFLSVTADEAVELVANLMAWHRVRYVPVEDDEHRLVGLVSDRSLLRFLTSDDRKRSEDPVAVSHVMEEELVTASPSTATLEAIDLMRRQSVPCLPVVQDGRLVGMVTENDFLDIAGQLLERRLEESTTE